MKKQNKHNEIPDNDTIIKYLKGELQVSEQHRIEKMMLENPLFRDAVEGLADLGESQISNDIDDLKVRIDRRTGNAGGYKFSLYRIAVVVLLLAITSAAIFYYLEKAGLNKDSKNIALEQKSLTSKTENYSDEPLKVIKPQPETQSVESAQPGLSSENKETTSGFMDESDKLSMESEASKQPHEFQKPISGNYLQETVSGNAKDDTVNTLGDINPVYSRENTSYEKDSEQAVELQAYQDLNENNIATESAEPIPSSDIHIQENARSATRGKKQARLSEPMVVPTQFNPEKNPSQPVSGYPAFRKYLSDSLRYPGVAKENGIVGKVVVSFTITPDSIPVNFQILHSLGHGCDEEAIRLIKYGPKWIPSPITGNTDEIRNLVEVPFQIKD